MATFDLTDVQREFRRTLRAFCEERVAPHAAEVDRMAEFPWQSYEAIKEIELPALGIPETYGGAGADTVTQAIAVEELSRVCASTSLTFLISKLGMTPVLNWGTEDLKRTYVPKVAAGEIQASYCLSEADAGSDVASMRCRAGARRRRLRAGRLEILDHERRRLRRLHRVRQDRPQRRQPRHQLLPGREGVGRHRGQARGQARHAGEPDRRSDARRSARPGIAPNREEGQGFTIAMHTLDRSRPTIGAQAVGIAQGAIDYAAAYMKQRHAFGAPIADLQGLRFMLADMATRTEAARALVYRACAMVDHDPDGELTRFGAMAKAFASDTSMSVTVDAVQLLGGYGYTKDFPVERFLRDAKVTQIYEGTNQVQRVVIAREILKSV